MKKFRFGRMGIGAGTKVQQSNLRSLAREMAEDPGILVPECAGPCSRCPMDKMQARLRKIQVNRDNPKALKRLASGGRQLERSYAAMLILASENGPILFANARLPTGDVSYTMRGKVKKEFLVGLQHFDDPKLRLLAYTEWAFGRKLNLYSLNDGLVCSGKKPKYPQELISEVMASSSHSLSKHPGGFRCEHAGEGYGLRIDILSADTSIELCMSCSSEKANTYTRLTSRMLARKPEADFRITLEHDIHCLKGSGCTLSGSVIKTSDLVARYLKGELSDRALIVKYEERVRETLEKAGKTIFVLGNTCFEDDYERFIRDLDPSEMESLALKRVLKNAESPVVMDAATPNSVFSVFWDKQGANAIHAVTGDKELARSLFLETRGSGKTPVQILREAAVRSRSKEALSALPDLRKLGRLGTYADGIARTYRALGKDEALKKVGTLQDDTKARSISCGFLVALGALKGREWQFSKEELDYGAYLANFINTLLNTESGKYSDALQCLLTASGTNETVG